MRERQETLERLLRGAGYPVGMRTLPRPSAKVRGAGRGGTWSEVGRLYEVLGGVLDKCPLQTGPWDIAVGGVAIELDEEQHFNR